MYHTIAFSDIHLGSSRSQHKLIRRELRRIRKRTGLPEQILLVGDITNRSPVRKPLEKLSRDERKLLRYLLKLEAKKVRVVWIEGNHDEGITGYQSPLLPRIVVHSYNWKYSADDARVHPALRGKKFLAIHGHQFDPAWLFQSAVTKAATDVGLRTHERLEQVGQWAADAAEVLFTQGHRRIRHRHFPEQAAAHASVHGYDHIICGHTHLPVRCRMIDGVHYHNCGCAKTPKPKQGMRQYPTYLTIGTDGVHLHSIKS